MGLFDMFKKKSEPAAPAGPAPVSAQAAPDTPQPIGTINT